MEMSLSLSLELSVLNGRKGVCLEWHQESRNPERQPFLGDSWAQPTSRIARTPTHPPPDSLPTSL